MSSKLALLLKQTSKRSASNVQTQNIVPAKRQKKAASKDTPSAAAKASQQFQQPIKKPNHSKAADSDAEEDDIDVPATTEVYSALVGMLSSKRGALGAAIKQHKAQQEGASDDGDDESDDDDEDEGSDDEDDEPGSDSEEAEDAAAAAAAGSSSDDGEDDKADLPTANGASKRLDNQQAAASGSKQHKKQNKQQQRGEAEDDEDAAGETTAAPAAAAAASHWDSFMSRDLSPDEISSLSSGRHQWTELPAQQDVTDGLWKKAKWQLAGRRDVPALHSDLTDYGVKERLITRWREVQQADAERLPSQQSSSSRKQQRCGDFSSPQQQVLFSLCDSYSDILYSAKPYPGGSGWSASEADEAVDAVLLHVLNHCAKTADVIKKNNDKIKAAEEGDISAIPRDQGFTRAKALILLPMRNMAFQLVRRLVALAQKETRADSVQGKEKFIEQFIGEDEDEEQQQQQQQQQDGDGQQKKKTKGVQKPAEHRALFRGNLDDHFRLGIRITRGQIKLFADLLQSDIIIASPVGLATKLAEDAAAAALATADKSKGGRGGKGAAAGSAGSAAAVKGGECDFLSSIEVCVLERADVMMMQNWQHVITVLESLNQLPKQQHGTDIMRVRSHLLAGQGKLFRQTIITSSFAAPLINAAFNQLCCSHAGKFKLVSQPSGVLAQVIPQVRQVFERFTAASTAAAADARFEFFKTSIWPRLTEGAAAAAGGLMIFVPSYFDFVRLRNFLKSEEAEFTVLSEYCSFSSVTRARAVFFQRRKRIMLYTERAHFYHRYRVRGIQDIVFYGLPDHAHFYSELVNLVQSGSASAAAAHHATITALFCKFDALALSRVVGQSRATKMLAAETPTFMFC